MQPTDADSAPPSVTRQSPLDPDLDVLFQRHVEDMHADTPPGSIHMLPREALQAEGIAFYVLRATDGVPLAMGAIKRLGDGTEGELKSMHVLAEHRGRGLSRRLLEVLMIEAGAAGMRRLSLETGTQPTFVAARALYARSGFRECGPFGDYTDDPNSVFMTRSL